MARLIVLEDSAIRSMLQNNAIVNEFPFMKAAAEKVQPKKRRGCKCGAKGRSNSTDFSGIRAAIAGMSLENKAKLKQLLGTDEVRLYYTNVKRQRVKMTF